MSHPLPNLITLSSTLEQQLTATSAELMVTVQGSSLFTGQAALTQAREVRALVESLASVGVSLDAIHLQAVHAEVASGLLGKSASASYRLRVAIGDLERLPDALGAITSAKNVRMEGIVWRYPESSTDQAAWIGIAVANIKVRADAAARALGARLVGVHRFTEQSHDNGYHDPVLQASVSYGTSRARAANLEPVNLGFEMTGKKQVSYTVTVEYLIETPALRG
jgi:uncharacterized protein YggE